MKLLISITFVLLSITASAQKLGDYFNGQLYKKNFDSLLKRSFKIGMQTSAGWHTLPQDHMPCFVPDTKEVSKIKNLWNEPVLVFRDGNMPNAALPPDKNDKKEQ
jgi:hypothetical protein